MDPVNKLTVVIPFLNEGEEVRNTISSIREFVKERVDIILINDASDDHYDYDSDIVDYNVIYVKNQERKGSAISRELGIGMINTPYFLSLDAHMRFYNGDWPGIIVDRLEENDRKLLCCQTKVLNKSFCGEIIEPESSKVFGAYIHFEKNQNILEVSWKKTEACPGSEVEQIPCVLGAAYAGSKRYWSYLRGLEGLVSYGCEEPYVSMKVYLEGGICELLKNVVVGHIYRKRFPYQINFLDLLYNRLLIAELLLPSSLKYNLLNEFESMNKEIFNSLCLRLKENSVLIEELKIYYKYIFKNCFEFVFQLNTHNIII